MKGKRGPGAAAALPTIIETPQRSVTKANPARRVAGIMAVFPYPRETDKHLVKCPLALCVAACDATADSSCTLNPLALPAFRGRSCPGGGEFRPGGQRH